jgi:amidophosphoribosyltransferase
MCGLIGVHGTLNAAKEVFLGLMNLQHRGQDGAGILAIRERSTQFALQKGSGLIENIFAEQAFKNLAGRVAIGHARYATVGRQDPNLLQPFLDAESGIAIGHNGNIVNFYMLRAEIAAVENYFGSMNSDSEVILHILSQQLLKTSDPTEVDIFNAVEFAMGKLIGSYAVVGADTQGRLFGFRDPDGIRPLVMGRKDGQVALASESVALQYLGYTDIEEIGPGECVIVDSGSVKRKILVTRSYSPCMFEWVYFARVESDMGGSPIYKARFDLGLLLADQLKREGITADVVIPVPETSRAAAIAIAESMTLPFRELLIKNRYVNRTFILDRQEARQEAIKRKLFPIAAEIKGKRCLVVDDSIVRGNTAQQIIDLLRQAGAKEVVLVSTCPPIRFPCYYGIDFPSPSELIASNKSEAQIAELLGADRVIYLSVEGLKAALQQKSLCTGCLTNEYPTDVSMGLEFEKARLEDREQPLPQG